MSLRIHSDHPVTGGTKRRALERMVAGPWSVHERFVYASPAFGLAQVALAATLGERATIFTAKRKVPHELTQRAIDLGAHVVMVPYGYLSNTQHKARVHAEVTGSFLVPFGMDCEEAVDAISEVAQLSASTPEEVWCAGGSGTLTRGLQRAWPSARHHCVLVGSDTGRYGTAELHRAPEPYEKPARRPKPGVQANPNYDAKVWQFAAEGHSGDALWWIVD